MHILLDYNLQAFIFDPLRNPDDRLLRIRLWSHVFSASYLPRYLYSRQPRLTMGATTKINACLISPEFHQAKGELCSTSYSELHLSVHADEPQPCIFKFKLRTLAFSGAQTNEETR